MASKAKKFVLKQHFVGEPKDEDLQLEEEDLPELNDGGKYWDTADWQMSSDTVSKWTFLKLLVSNPCEVLHVIYMCAIIHGVWNDVRTSETV